MFVARRRDAAAPGRSWGRVVQARVRHPDGPIAGQVELGVVEGRPRSGGGAAPWDRPPRGRVEQCSTPVGQSESRLDGGSAQITTGVVPWTRVEVVLSRKGDLVRIVSSSGGDFGNVDTIRFEVDTLGAGRIRGVEPDLLPGRGRREEGGRDGVLIGHIGQALGHLIAGLQRIGHASGVGLDLVIEAELGAHVEPGPGEGIVERARGVDGNAQADGPGIADRAGAIHIHARVGLNPGGEVGYGGDRGPGRGGGTAVPIEALALQIAGERAVADGRTDHPLDAKHIAGGGRRDTGVIEEPHVEHVVGGRVWIGTHLPRHDQVLLAAGVVDDDAEARVVAGMVEAGGTPPARIVEGRRAGPPVRGSHGSGHATRGRKTIQGWGRRHGP